MAVGLAVLFLSLALLGHEILLMRLLSITQWHHFAYMIISLALLGIGASGTFTTLFQKFLIPRFHSAFCINALLFSLTVPAGFAIAQHVPLNPLEILWDGRQWLHLFKTYCILLVPFFLAGNGLTLALTHTKEAIHRIYFFDLLGAGFGAIVVILLLFYLPPWQCLPLLSAFGLASSGLIQLARRRRRSNVAGSILLIGAVAFPLAWPQEWLQPHLSPYKELSTALHIPGTRIIDQRSGPLGWLVVVESPKIPFRHAPGMSLQCTDEPPPQLGVFVDGDSMTPITRFDGRVEPLAFLDCLTAALPYHLLSSPRALVLGAGGGMDVLMALTHGARSVDAVELDRNMISLVRDRFGEYAGHVYDDDRVTVHAAEARSFVSRSEGGYDCIQVSLLDSFGTSAAGGYGLSESYLYTVEALTDLYRRLSPGGVLSITRWLQVPPRDSLKLLATSILALERSGSPSPGEQIALIRSWKTTTLLMKKGAFSVDDRERMRTFCEKRSFDIDHCPGIRPGEAPSFNRLDQPYLAEGAAQLLGAQREAYLDRYKLAIEPATDDRPYFFHSFKWRTAPEILAMKARGGLPLMEWTYPVLIVTLAQALILSLGLIVIPLFFLERKGTRGVHGGRLVLYFSALGLAFLFVEMAFIQKLVLFLGHPIYAASVVIASFLVFAGLGSRFSPAVKRAVSERTPNGEGVAILCVIGGIALFAAMNVGLLHLLMPHFAAMREEARIALSIALLAPLAFCMGMPFPLGLAIVAESRPEWVPWAWGINGCASVLAAILATLLAIHFGFSTVVLVATLLYGLAALVFWKPFPVDSA